MLYTLAALIVFSAIMVFFSQEFVSVFKRILEIKGAKLVLPIVLGSYLIFVFEEWVIYFLSHYRDFLQAVNDFLTRILPFDGYSSQVSLVIIFSLISVIPVYLLDWYLVKRTFHKYKYPYITSSIIWITTVILLLMHPLYTTNS